MLTLRNKFKVNGMTMILWVALASMFLGSAIPLFLRKNSGEPWSIRVNDQEVSFNDFRREMAFNTQYIAAIRAQYGQMADYLLQSMGVRDARSLTIQQLMMRQLASQALASIGTSLSPEYIAHKIHDKEFVSTYLRDVLPAQLLDATGSINSKALNVYVQQRGMKVSEFQEQLLQHMEQWFLDSIVTTFVYTPQYARDHELMQKNGLKSFSVITLAHEYFLKEVQKEAVSDAELAAFYERENKASRRYHVPEKRSGVQWEFTPEVYGVSVSDHSIEAYYEKHKTKKFVQNPTTIHVRKLVFTFDDSNKEGQKIKADQVHAQVAKDTSLFKTLDGVENVKPFSRGQKDRAFERAAFILKQDGDISPVVELDNSFVILQRIQKEAQTYKPLKDVQKTIRKTLEEQKFAKVFARDAKKIVSQESNVVQSFIKEHNGKRSELKSVARVSSPTARALFSAKQDGFTFYEDGKLGSIVQLTSIEKAYTPSLDVIKEDVRNDIYSERATKAQNVQVALVRKEFENTPGVTVERIEGLSSSTPEKFSDLRKKGLDHTKMLALEKEGSILLIEDGINRHLVRLDSISKPEENSSEEMQQTDLQRLQQMQKRAFSQAFIASLRRAATIEINDIIAMIEEENTI